MLQVKQWGEIQAHSRKMSYSKFISLAGQKREELVGVLRSLEEGVPATLKAIAEKMELLQEGALWFPGGSKEMRVCGRGHFGSRREWYVGGATRGAQK